MDEVLKEESCIAGWWITARAAVRVLVILFGIVLAGNPALRDMAQDFLNAPIVPKAKSEGRSSVGSKQDGRVLKPDQAVMRDEKELIFKNPVSDEEAVSDELLAAASVPEMPLQLPYISDEEEIYLAEVLVETIPAAEKEILPEENLPEISSDSQIMARPIIPDTIKSDEAAKGRALDAPMNTEPDDFMKTEIMNMEPDDFVNTDDSMKTEIMKTEPDDSVKTEIMKTESDDSMKTETVVPQPEISVAEKPVDDTAKAEVTVPKEEPVVSGNTENDSTASEITAQDPSVSEPVISDPPADDSSVTEPIAPEPETSVPDVTDEVTSNDGEDSGGAEEIISCFLLDDAGMLYGFLPEYAEIPDGCLVLPEECTGIRSGAFSGCGAGILEIYIPAGAATIEEGAFAGLNFLEWIEVDSGNPVYTTDSGVLFDSTMSVLLAFPSAWTEGYAVPGSVTRIAARAFENTSISILDVRACRNLSFDDNAFGASAGSGVRLLVPPADYQVYEEILSGYAVEITQ